VKINGKDASKKYSQRYYSGTKKNNTPGKAALHALSKMPTNEGLNKKSKITFSLIETTHGSAKKIWGPYEGKFVKLVESRKVTRRNPKTGKTASYMVHYKPMIALANEK